MRNRSFGCRGLAWLVVVMGWAASEAPASPDVPTSLDLETVRAIPVQHDGRYMPLDTLARDLVQSVTGTQHYENLDPVVVLLSWTFEPDAWLDEPMIRIPNAELRREIHLPESVEAFSYRQLTAHRYLHTLVDESDRLPPGEKPDALQKKVRDIYQKLLRLHQCFEGRAIPLIPSPDDPLAAWAPISLTRVKSAGSAAEVQRAWQRLAAAFRADDADAFVSQAAILAGALNKVPAAFRPDGKLIATELRYNRLRPFRSAWMVLLAGAVLSLVGLKVRRRWLDAASGVVMLGGFVLLTFGLAMRWKIAGRIPASNMFESLLFLSWGAGAFAIVSMFLLRHRIVPATAASLSCIALVMADCLPMNQFVRPIPPVLLDTVWMSIHVPIVMTSYSVLALGVLFAHLQLASLALAPRNTKLRATIDSIHYWYIHVGSILLFAGIVTGSIWAASSWGRYWGWDPKEVWSLVALLGYLTILHTRTAVVRSPRWSTTASVAVGACVVAMVLVNLPNLTVYKVLAVLAACGALAFLVLAHGMVSTALKSILAFWLIIMTYVGVNYVLGIGLHSYGFGGGAVVRRSLEAAGLDLAFVLVCCGVYLARRKGAVGYGRSAGVTGLAVSG